MPASKPIIAELLEQMPRVDREIEAEKAAQKTPPVPDLEDSKFTGPDPELADKICAEVFDGGRGSVVELIEMIHAPGDAAFKNYKAEYLCHCLTTYAGSPGRDAHRKQLVETLIDQIGNAALAPYVRTFLVRE